jgi:hypothetical protein
MKKVSAKQASDPLKSKENLLKDPKREGLATKTPQKKIPPSLAENSKATASK